MDCEKTSYSNASNARRAARKAGLREFDVYKASDNWYKIRAAAAKAVKPAKSVKPTKTAKPTKLAAKPTSKRAAVLADAQGGKLPSPPDFSAPTHARYRDTLGELVALAKAGNIEVLKRLEFKTYSSSPKAMAKYRDLAVIALEAATNIVG
jgi:hypothetical protein